MAELAEPVAHLEVQVASCLLSSQVQPTSCLDTLAIGEGGDKPLESHEVVELKTFSDRKAWIEDKIKFLESLPPIDVFYGLKYLCASAAEVPGLPTREQLQAMVVEHDAIEKETEVFDTGELKKLRQLTKAATQRNLSPADTDLIELTLTTIYELDKLLHLLRDRSDNLEMMSTRLTWEENRQAGWRERHQVIEDLRMFVESRGRWSSSIYDHSSRNQEPSDPYAGRGSVASLASAGSSDSVVNSPAFSRSARFKLAELLSRDAAQYTGRVTSLKHGMITAAGKALDKLIDHSRRPVPDELLDEQDRLEEMCISDLENIGKFTLSLVMQWRKADEIYVETMKDQLSAANLLEDIETAQMYHPTARQSASFISRIDTILKRLAVRGDPASASLFPRPEHPLFQDQKEANISLDQKLSNDLSAANRLARKVDDAAKEYRSRYEAIKRVEELTQSTNEVCRIFTTVNKKFCEGTSGDDGDGAPPDLTTEVSLEPTHHNVFLALLPSLLEETNSSVEKADELLRSAPSVLSGLDLPGIDQEFKETAVASVRNLSFHRGETIHLRDSVVRRVTRLRESRKIASNIDSKLALLKSARTEIARVMDQHRWHQESGDASAPLTPESPLADLTSSPISLSFEDQLARVSSSLQSDVGEPLDKLSFSLEPELHFVLKQRYSNLHATVDASYQLLRLLGSIKDQTSAMVSIRDSFHKLSVEVEDARIRCSSQIDVLLGSHSDDATDSTSEFNAENMDFTEKEVTLFLEGLTSQVPFVARHSRFSKRSSLIPPMSPIFNDSNGLVDIWSEIPFDLASVDAAVRADSNYYAMRISGNLEGLLQTKTHLNLAQLAIQLDNALSATVQDIDALSQQFSTQKDFFNAVKRHCPETIGHIQDILNELDIFRAKRNNIARSLSPIRDLLRQMEEISRRFSPTIRNLYDSRIHATDDAELRLQSWDDWIETLRHEIRLALDDEKRYQDDVKAAETQRILEDEKRQAAEEAERLRCEQERHEEEEKLLLLEAKRVEEELREQERRRISAELIEKERLQREAVEAELLRREEEERHAEAARIKLEQERIAKEEADKAFREQERQEMVEKLHFAEEKLEQEREIHAVNERIARELAEKQEMEIEKLAQRQAEMERLALGEREENERQNRMRLEQEGKERLKQTKRKGKARAARLPTIPQDAEDVFTIQNTSSGSAPLSRHILELQSQVIQLRKRLRSMELNEAGHPTKSSADLPTEGQFESMSKEFADVSDFTQKLPLEVDDIATDRELQSLRTEVQESSRLLKGVEKLAQMQKAVQVCDGALSDLLEHIDSYPAPPLGASSLHKSQPGAPEEQLSARLAFTKQTVDDATSTLTDVIEDSRATSEHDRIQQTWSELNEMAVDRMVGKKSRSPSVISGHSSGRNSSASSQQPFRAYARNRKTRSYANLSVSSIILPSRPTTLAPPHNTARRAVSGSREIPSRSTSRLSTSNAVSRAVSGPVRNMLHETTFASRQRTTSLTCSSSAPLRLPTSLAPAIQIRTESGRRRPGSPMASDHQRSQSRSFIRTARAPSRASSNSSTWARAPRDSISSIMQRNVTPQKKPAQSLTRKKYVADPKSKLDVAVGDVVNKLPVGINVEGITESWHDQSGKYWIGNDDPKLCFCRILRSQTVMVRVGGGWTELSKFIKNHFADSFRILPESPPRTGVPEAKWISSATLLEEQASPPAAAPRTPEPTFPFLPTFALMTPSARSPCSLKSSPSTKGSPLTPIQFIRKADSDLSLLRPVTPSKTPHRSRMPSSPNTPVWRP